MSYELYLGQGDPAKDPTGFFTGYPFIARSVEEFRNLLRLHGVPAKISVPYWLKEDRNEYETTVHCIFFLVWDGDKSVQFPQWKIHAHMDKIHQISTLMDVSKMFFNKAPA